MRLLFKMYPDLPDTAVSQFHSSKLRHAPEVPGLNLPLLDVSNAKQQDWSEEVLLRSIENTVGEEIGSSVSGVMDFSLHDLLLAG